MEASEDRRRDLLRKVRGLLDKADGEEALGHAAAAQAYRLKADELMAKYAIEEFELAFDKNANRSAPRPEVRRFDYGELPYEIRRPLIDLFGHLARHCGVRLGEYFYSHATLVGFPQDLDYLELMYTSLRLHMSANITPQPSRELGYEASLALLKESGKKWREIYPLMVRTFPERFLDSVAYIRRNKTFLEERTYSWNADKTEREHIEEWVRNRRAFEVGDHVFVSEIPRPIGVRFTKEYTDFCKATGRERVYSDPQVYLRSFVSGYTQKIRQRLYEMDRHREEMTTGKELVLASMKSVLDEALWDAFPHLRPHPEDCDCDRCHGFCRNEACRRPQCIQYRRDARKPVRASAYREVRYDPAAGRRGSAAAATADLSGATGKVERKSKELE